jgi:hypothetical protein
VACFGIAGVDRVGANYPGWLLSLLACAVNCSLKHCGYLCARRIVSLEMRSCRITTSGT